VGVEGDKSLILSQSLAYFQRESCLVVSNDTGISSKTAIDVGASALGAI